MNDEYKPIPGEVIAGALDIGISADGREVVINAADVMVDENGRCFFKFSPRQARHLARVMTNKAGMIDLQPNPDAELIKALADNIGEPLTTMLPGLQWEQLCERVMALQREKVRWQDEYAASVSAHENTKALCDHLEGLRDSESKLIRNLAEAVEIHLTARRPSMLEQFRAGVLRMKERSDRQRETIVQYQETDRKQRDEMGEMVNRWKRLHELLGSKPDDDWDQAPFEAIERLQKQNEAQATCIAHFSRLAMTYREMIAHAIDNGFAVEYARALLESGKLPEKINDAQFEEWFAAQTNRPPTDSLDDLSRAIARMAWNAARGVQDSQPNG